MTPQEIETLAKALPKLGISVLEIQDDNQGVALRLRLRPENPNAHTNNLAPAGERTAAANTSNISTLLRSPGMGRFAACHPLLDSPAATSGQRVEAGQAVGYLLAGTLLSEITSQRAAVLGRQLVKEGELVGYGDGVFELL